MQSLEIAVAAGGVGLLIVLLSGVGVSRSGVGLLLAAAIAVVSIEIGRQGFRWHMVPAYVAIVIVLASLGFHGMPRVMGAAIAAAGFVAAIALCVAFPVFSLPFPTGQYPVGTLTLTFSDPGRARELPVQIFYPARAGSGGPQDRSAYYMPRAETSRATSQIALVRTHAMVNADLAEGTERLPLVIYSPSWGGNRHENTNLMEDLASHGYVVASLDVPGEASVTLFPDGRVLRGAPDPWLDFSSQDQLERTRVVVNRHLARRVADVRFVRDRLALLSVSDRDGKFYRRLDSERAGILGFSFGGSTAAEVCREDSRFRAGVNLDGFSFGLLSDADIPCAFMVIEGGEEVVNTAGDPSRLTPYERLCANDYERLAKSFRTYGGYLFTMARAEHANFSDRPFYSRLRRYTGGGPIDPRRAISVTRDSVRNFFDRELRGNTRKAAVDGLRKFPEVTLVSGKPQ